MKGWQLYRVEIAGRERPVYIMADGEAHARAEVARTQRVPLAEVMDARPSTTWQPPQRRETPR